MKKIISIFLLLILSFSFAACDKASKRQAPTYSISYVLPEGYSEAISKEYPNGDLRDNSMKVFLTEDGKELKLEHKKASPDYLIKEYGENCDNKNAQKVNAKKLTIDDLDGVFYSDKETSSFVFYTNNALWTISGSSEQDVLKLAESIRISQI